METSPKYFFGVWRSCVPCAQFHKYFGCIIFLACDTNTIKPHTTTACAWLTFPNCLWILYCSGKKYETCFGKPKRKSIYAAAKHSSNLLLLFINLIKFLPFCFHKSATFWLPFYPAIFQPLLLHRWCFCCYPSFYHHLFQLWPSFYLISLLLALSIIIPN